MGVGVVGGEVGVCSVFLRSAFAVIANKGRVGGEEKERQEGVERGLYGSP